MKRLRGLILLLILLAAPGVAGVRATYAVEHSRPLLVEIADNGDFTAELSPDRRVVVRGEAAYIVEDRLTGPLVTRVEDLAELARSRRPVRDSAAARREIELLPRGTVDVNGRSGEAFATPTPFRQEPEQLVAVISGDPTLADLGRAMRRLFAIQALIEDVETSLSAESAGWHRPLMEILERGTPLRYWNWTLREVERVPIAAETIVLPADPETREALAARLAPEPDAAENEAFDAQMISRAVFGAGRLWLLTDSGVLTSLAERETVRTPHDLDEPVIDICVGAEIPHALTGRRSAGAAWTLRRFENGSWQRVRSVRRARDAVLAMSCRPGAPILLTSRRLIDLNARGDAAVRLSESVPPALVRTVVHVTPEFAFVGLNAGEWGGGLLRIERETGRVERIERNTTGDLCGGPLNTDCDPVNGIATIPWRPQCVAAAVGLIHFMARGRLVQACGDRVEQLVAVADADLVDPADARRVAEAASGELGSVAFFGLAARGDQLIGVGHDGLYRLDSSGAVVRQRWPRFSEIDGVYVSFALPEVVLVLTQLNRLASISGSSPLLVIR